MLHCIEVAPGSPLPWRVVNTNTGEMHSAHAIRREAYREALRWRKALRRD